MGDMADDWYEQELLYQLEVEATMQHCLSNDIWITSDGRTIPLSDMTENHLRNAINFIKRNPGKIPYDAQWLPKLRKALSERVDSRWVI